MTANDAYLVIARDLSGAIPRSLTAFEVADPEGAMAS
jgi:hypothetical protein